MVIGVGVGGALAASKANGMAVLVTASSIVTAFVVAATVGIFFGWYPTRKASLLRPIDALRFQWAKCLLRGYAVIRRMNQI